MKTFSLYEAKARLSEIIRMVRERGESVTISYHGQPVAEIRPIESPEGETALDRRLRELSAQGVVSAPTGRKLVVRPLAKRPGALARFLEERE